MRVLSIRVSGKERKKKVRNLLLDLAHFRNMLIILITKYKELYGTYPLHQSILYGLVAKTYTGKYREEFEEALRNIYQKEKLKELLEKLKAQKEKVDNAPLVQYVILFKAIEKIVINSKEFPNHQNLRSSDT